jgi:hypothetical protein
MNFTNLLINRHGQFTKEKECTIISLENKKMNIKQIGFLNVPSELYLRLRGKLV